MKKVLAIVLSLVMVLALATAAFAAPTPTELTTPATGTETTIRAYYEMEVAYTVTIPADIEVDAYGTVDLTDTNVVSIANAMLEFDTTLSISIESEEGWFLVNTDSNTVKYTYEMTVNGTGEALENDDVVLSLDATDSEEDEAHNASAYLTAVLTQDPQIVGEYDDNLTFTVTYG